ncbi:MAG: hypothetical protein KGZ39_04145 [Simkania sp.]|nr:hypothetical protein [Simkania sp.]
MEMASSVSSQTLQAAILAQQLLEQENDQAAAQTLNSQQSNGQQSQHVQEDPSSNAVSAGATNNFFAQFSGH